MPKSEQPTPLRNPVARLLTALAVMLALGLVLAAASYPASARATQPAAFDQDLATVSAALNVDRVQPGQQAVIAVVLDVQPGYHAQSSEPRQDFLEAYRVFDIEADAENGLTAYAPIYPEGHLEHYPAIAFEGDGMLSVYSGRTVTFVPIEIGDVEPGTTLTIHGKSYYQICDDQICFPPTTREWTINVEVASPGEPVQSANDELFADFDPAVWSDLQPAEGGPGALIAPQQFDLGFGIVLNERTFLLAFAAAFLAGLIFNVVPCVLPVLPLKAMQFYEVAEHDRGRALALGVMFGGGIIATFGVLAVFVVALQWLNWGQLFSNPWFAGAMVTILVAVAAGMFGAFDVMLPRQVYGYTPRHDTFTGNFLFGILTAILSTPCTFGLFLGLLSWAAVQPTWLGVGVVMVTGLGMATPWVVLSGLPELARRFPRTGPWSEVVKQTMAFLILAVAVYFGSIFFPAQNRELIMWWGIFALIAVGGLYLVVRSAMLAGIGWQTQVSTVAALLVVGGSLWLTLGLTQRPMEWTMFSETALTEARDNGRPVVVKFTAVWCANCHTVERLVFGDEETIAELRRRGVTAIKADLTASDAEGWPLLRQLNPVGGIPLTAIYMPGEEEPRLLGGIYSSRDLLGAIETGS